MLQEYGNSCIVVSTYDYSKLELNSKKSNSNDAKFIFRLFFFALKAKFQALKFEFYQIKLGQSHG